MSSWLIALTVLYQCARAFVDDCMAPVFGISSLPADTIGFVSGEGCYGRGFEASPLELMEALELGGAMLTAGYHAERTPCRLHLEHLVPPPGLTVDAKIADEVPARAKALARPKTSRGSGKDQRRGGQSRQEPATQCSVARSWRRARRICLERLVPLPDAVGSVPLAATSEAADAGLEDWVPQTMSLDLNGSLYTSADAHCDSSSSQEAGVCLDAYLDKATVEIDTSSSLRGLAGGLVVCTDCSGLDVPMQALKALGVHVRHGFACDECPLVKRQLLANGSPETWYDDVLNRDHRQAARADIYVAGFPCQPFSQGGKQRGFADGRASVFQGCVDYISAARPAAFILENVPRLRTLHEGTAFQRVLEALAAVGSGAYELHVQVLDTRDHGVPQRRPRLYFVGLRRDAICSPFAFPQPLPRVSVEPFLAPGSDCPASSEARSNIARSMERDLRAEGVDPAHETYFLDIDSSAAWRRACRGCCPCITASRPRGFWVTMRSRRTTLAELCWLQGLSLPSKIAVTDRQLGRMLGNAMSGNVMERLMRQLLVAIGYPGAETLPDRWAAYAYAGPNAIPPCRCSVADAPAVTPFTGAAQKFGLASAAPGLRDDAAPGLPTQICETVGQPGSRAGSRASPTLTSPGDTRSLPPSASRAQARYTAAHSGRKSQEQHDGHRHDPELKPDEHHDSCKACWRLEVRALLSGMAQDAAGPAGGALREGMAWLMLPSGAWNRRPRCVLPLPAPRAHPRGFWRTVTQLDDDDLEAVLDFATLSVAALNHLYGAKLPPRPGPPTAPQLSALRGVVQRVLELHARLLTLGKPPPGEPGAAWASCEDAAVCQLVADRVDTPAAAGLVDPMPYLPAAWQETIADESKMFPDWSPHLRKFAAPHGPQRREYVRLALAQLRARKLVLLDDIAGGGGVFGRLKSDGVRMREIWHGAAVSKACAPPPMPPDLASPSTFCYQELRAGRTLEVTKRDASCYFDQLALPEALVRYMGRPRIWREEFLEAGCTEAELHDFLGTTGTAEREWWYPAARVWGMGFAWSSAVGQQVLVELCRLAGLDPSQILSPARPVPESARLQHAVATDDVMIFSDVPGGTRAAAMALDEKLARAGVQRNVEKDVDGATDVRCIGVDLVQGSRWCAPAERSWRTLADVRALLQHPRATPRCMASFLGSTQWYDLLTRSKLACYQHVYEFARREPEHKPAAVDQEVLDELLLTAALTPWWTVDLRKPFLESVLATDASTSYGYGGCIADVPIKTVRRMSRLCSQVGEGVTLAGALPEATPPDAHRLPLEITKDDFKVIFAVRARQKAHINVLEAEALNIGLSWLLRRPERHGRRIVVLLDSRVAIGAASKGRSSSQALLRCLRRTAALTLAGQLQPYYLYIGTDENPADAPSRGLLQRKREPKGLRRLQRTLQTQYARTRRLMDCGHARDALDHRGRRITGSGGACR